MSQRKMETIVNQKISPHTLNEKGKAEISKLLRTFGYDLLLESIDIGASTYFKYDSSGNLTGESVEIFLNKIGGIAYNKSRSPLDQELNYLKNKCKQYWRNSKVEEILNNYVLALKDTGYSEDQIITDLQEKVHPLCNNHCSWKRWSNTMMTWIENIRYCDDEDDIEIKQDGSILPLDIFTGTSSNLKRLCEQINASYESNLYDCTAVMMRRLLEGLLVLSYEKREIECEITAEDGIHRFTLDKIIKNAICNKDLKLSTNVKKTLTFFKDLGNYSAHSIWYNCTKQDIEPYIQKYRVVVEELLYKSGSKS